MLRLQLLGGIQLAAPDGRDLRPLLGRPKRFAMLAYLAAQEPGKFVRRDTLTGLFWAEMDQSGARKAVRQALYVLRTDLAEDVFEAAGDDEIRVVPERLWCDVPVFLDAVRQGRHEEALELYRGDLLTSFFIPEGAPEFERWLEEERGRLRTLAAKAAWDLAEGAERNRKSGPATTWGRKAMALTHDDETALRRLIQLLDRMGDRAGALRAYDTFARRLKEEYGDAPSAETQALIARVREREMPRQSPVPVPPLDSTPSAPSPPVTERLVPAVVTTVPAPAEPAAVAATAVARPGRRWIPVLGTLALTLLAGAAFWKSRQPSAVELSSSSRVSTRSAAAREHYRRGLEAWYARQNPKEATTELEAALAEDSTFAMAAYWLVTILDWSDKGGSGRFMDQAVRMARYATPDEQRLIELQQGLRNNDPRVEPLAELLVAQYPHDLVVLGKASQAALSGGRFDRSAELAHRVLQLDTTRVPTMDGPCPKCDAYESLVAGLIIGDSLAPAESLVRRWRAARPDDIRADKLMSHILEYQGRYPEARATALQMADRSRGDVDLTYQTVSIALRRGEVDSARALLRDSLAIVRDSGHAQFDWMLMATLRTGGRLVEARRLADQMVAKWGPSYEAQRAEVAYEAGEFAFAADRLRPDLERQAIPSSDGSQSPRNIAWALTRGSTYFAAAGDTTTLRVAAERLEQLAQLSAFGRDRRAFHYPRALLAEARGQLAEAEREYRAAMLAPADGYTRINFQLSRLLERQGRVAEAVPIFRSALNGDMISGSTLYLSRTEVHEALAQAFVALNQPDSARVHFDFVARAWAHADPFFQPRLAAARDYLAQHPAAR